MVFLVSFVAIMGWIFVPALLKYHGQHVLPFPKEGKKTLLKYFHYYQKLDSREKVAFEKKVHGFMRIKKFVPRGINAVTIEMKTLISACAVQLTFGLPNVYLQHFKRILVYPDEYYSNINKNYHKGEVNPRFGIICLSWRAFVKGYINKEGVNLGLHEMAHALHLENAIVNDEYDFLESSALDQWAKLTRVEIQRIQSDENTFFRKYGATDHYEFFAVAIENFFERPQEFKDQSPELYLTLTKLLNQDTLNRLG